MAANYKKLFKLLIQKNVKSVYEACGCPECTNGYRGRIAIQEVLLINQDIRDAISNNIGKEKLRNLVYKWTKSVLTKTKYNSIICTIRRKIERV